MKIGSDGQFDMLNKVRCRPKLKNAPKCYFWTGVLGPRPRKSGYSNKIAATRDTSMKIDGDGQFDMLKEVRYRLELKNAPKCYFQTGILGPRPQRGYSNKFAASCDISMKFGVDGQFDTLQNTGCRSRKICLFRHFSNLLPDTQSRHLRQ